MKIATIINYCSNEFQFIEEVTNSVQFFSNQVIVVMADHTFDGVPETPETIEAVEKVIKLYGADLLLFEYDHDITLKNGTRYWHNMCRWLGVSNMNTDIDYVLFLDADESCLTNSFVSWLNNNQQGNFPQTMKFSNYFYFREKNYQATTWEDSIVMAANREFLHNPDVMFAMERDSIYSAGNTQQRNICGLDGKPMFNHYSWVRNEEQMLKKVKCWGHNKDKDWESLVKEEFSRPFNGTDFVHGYNYIIGA